MSRITFTEGGDEWWFDPETGDYEYDGSNPLVRAMLDAMDGLDAMQTATIHGIDEHPGEVWDDLSPEERKDAVVKYITRFNGVELHERRETTNR